MIALARMWMRTAWCMHARADPRVFRMWARMRVAGCRPGEPCAFAQSCGCFASAGAGCWVSNS